MKVKARQEFHLTINKRELNAMLLGLSKIRQEKWLHEEIEFYGYGGVRDTTQTTIDKLIQQLERL